MDIIFRKRSLKTNLKNFRKSLQWVIKKIKQIKIGFHFELKIQKIKKQISLPTLRISGSKSRIYVSLAFKSDTQRRSPSYWDEEDLYLNGQGYDAGGKAINFGETFRMEHGLSQQQGNIQHRWQLTVFESRRIRISEASAGHGDSYGEDDIMCDKSHVFEKGGSKGWNGNQWDRAVAKVKFKLENCNGTGSRRECDIEIEDSNRFKNKNSSAFKDKPRKTTKDLYLKGQGYDSVGKPVNFDEKMPPEDSGGVGDGQTKYIWQLAVYKSGTARFMTTGGGSMGSSSGDVDCNRKDVFEVTNPNVGGDWEKPVADIPCYLVNTDIAIRQEIFEMKGI